MASDTLQLLQEQVRAAAAAGTPLCLQGGGTKSFYGNAAAGVLLETRAHSGIVNYEPSELVITARCGTTLAEVERTLASEGQMLAFEPPHFGAAATLGGCISAGLSGPRRVAVGAVRDFLLGVKIIDGRGEALSFGGQVMKNVAGYDVARLMCGALGTLGLITEASVKVLPRPVAELTLRFELDEARALASLTEWNRLPLPLSASAIAEGMLLLRLSGAARAVEAAHQRLGGEVMPSTDAEAYWRQLREQNLEFFTSTPELPLWRLSLAATTPSLQLPGRQLIEWHGALRWARTAAPASQVRIAATAAGGHATLFRSSGPAAAVFTPVSPVLMALHRRLKHSFDPQRIFNRGRIYADL
jgi:glycolate oxidase FAD binding subunit